MALEPDVGSLLSGFQLERVLSEDAASKSAALLGRRVFSAADVATHGITSQTVGAASDCYADIGNCIPKIYISASVRSSCNLMHLCACCVACSFPAKEGQTVLIISRRHFPLDNLQQLVRSTRMSLQFNNDIYSKASGFA